MDGSLTDALREAEKASSSDGEESRDQHIHIRLPPSGKEILEQEADRCGKTMTRILETYAIEQISHQGKSLPVPNVQHFFLEKAEALEEMLKVDHDLGGRLTILKGEFSSKKGLVQTQMEKRSILKEQMRREGLDSIVGYRVTEKQKRWYEERAEDMGVSVLVRRKAFEGIEEQEDFERTIDWVKDWEYKTTRLTDWIEDEDTEDAKVQKGLRILSREIRSTVMEEYYSS